MARTTIDITIPDLTGRRAVLTGGSDEKDANAWAGKPRVNVQAPVSWR